MDYDLKILNNSSKIDYSRLQKSFVCVSKYFDKTVERVILENHYILTYADSEQFLL